MSYLPVTVIKCNLQGQETWRYSGQVLRREARYVELEALFNRPDVSFHEIYLKQGDRFVETFYTDRWYNIFEIHDCDDDQIKGWYCNIGQPAHIHENSSAGSSSDGDPALELVVSYIDLALDLLVYPNGRQLVLDEDEFAALPLTTEQKLQALQGLEALQALFIQRFPGR